MDSGTVKRISLLAILLFVVVLGVGELSGTFDIADSDGANTGFSTQDIPASNEYVVPNKAMFSLTYTTPTTVNIGDKVYYKFKAFSFKTGPELDLFNKLKAGKPCYVFQKGFDGSTHTDLFTGSKHYEFTKKESGATGPYYQLNDVLWSKRTTPGKLYIRTYYRCGLDPSYVKIDASSLFTFVDPSSVPPDDSDLITACNLKDTQYCQNGKLVIKDYTYSAGDCSYKKTIVENDACFDKYMVGICAEQGLEYDSTANVCKGAPVVTCDGSPEYATKCVGETEYQCRAGSWVLTGTDNCVVATNCDGSPQGATKCVGELEYRCDSGSWVQTGSNACKDVSWFEKYGGVLFIAGVVVVGMLMVFGALLLRMRARK